VTAVIGKVFGFNVSVQIDKESNWFSKEGDWNDANATFSGVLGSVINQEVDFSIAPWKRTPERSTRVDFTQSFNPNNMIMVSNALQYPINYSMFFSPFRLNSWRACISVSVLIVTILGLPNYLIRDYDEGWFARRIVILTSWMFFILINAYFR
jgi:hypothetical protein